MVYSGGDSLYTKGLWMAAWTQTNSRLPSDLKSARLNTTILRQYYTFGNIFIPVLCDGITHVGELGYDSLPHYAGVQYAN